MNHGQTNRGLKKALLEILQITPQGLSARVQKKIKDHLGLTTALATYLIAHENGLRIDKFLKPDELKEFRQVLGTQTVVVSPPKPAPIAKKPSRGRVPRVVKGFDGKTYQDPMLLPTTLTEAQQMAEVYTILYWLENSIRNFIIEVMAVKHGKDWWETQLTHGNVRDVKNRAEVRILKEKQKTKWHQQRGPHPINYTDFEDLGKLIFGKRGDFFPDPLGDEEFVKSLFIQIMPSRNVTCHMNPLNKTNLNDIQVRYEHWLNIAKAYKESHP